MPWLWGGHMCACGRSGRQLDSPLLSQQGDAASLGHLPENLPRGLWTDDRKGRGLRAGGGGGGKDCPFTVIQAARDELGRAFGRHLVPGKPVNGPHARVNAKLRPRLQRGSGNTLGFLGLKCCVVRRDTVYKSSPLPVCTLTGL